MLLLDFGQIRLGSSVFSYCIEF